MKTKTAYIIRLENGQYLNPCFTPRPAKVSDDMSTWDYRDEAEVYASQVGGIVEEHAYEYIPVYF